MDILLAGLVSGSTYALIAIGVSLVFGVSNIVNFAQGSVFAVGGMLGWFSSAVLGFPLWLTAIGVIAVTSVLGLAIYLVAVRPLRKAPGIAVLLATFAIGIILDNTSQRIFGAETKRFPSAFERSNLELFGFRFGTLSLVIIGVSLTCVVVLALVLTQTKIGRAIRATAQDPEAAQQVGIPVETMQALSFVIASALGGVAGVLVGMYFSNVSPTMGFMAGLQGFAAATIGGLGSIAGAVIGGLVLGIAEAFGVALWGDSVRQLITFGSLLLVLWIKPGGILGRVATLTAEPLTGTFFGAGRPLKLPPLVAAALIGALALAPLLTGDYVLRAGALVWIYALFALSVTVAGGFAGQIVLGQAGALALGAYTSALLVTEADWSFWPSFFAAGLVAAMVQVLLTAPTWRLRGHYVSMATLATGAFIAALALNLPQITNGARGISGIPKPTLFGLSLGAAAPMYLLTLGVLALALIVVSRLGASRLGRIWAAVREDEVAASSAGLHPAAYKSLAFGVGSAIAGCAGALYASQVTFLEPSQFGVALSVLAVTVAILGGLRAPAGVVIGAIILVGVPELFRGLAEWRLLFYGVLLLSLVLLRPQGVWSRFARIDRWIDARRRRRPARSPVGAPPAVVPSPAVPSPSEVSSSLDVAPWSAAPPAAFPRLGATVPLLRVEGLTKRFGGLTAVSDVSFVIAAGEVVAVIGPNGSGKTSTLNLVSGVIAADSGQVWLGDTRFTGRKPHQIARLGLTRTFQNGRVIGNLTVRDNVLVGIDGTQVPGGWLREVPGLRWGPLLGEVVAAIFPVPSQVAQRRLDDARVDAELARFGERLAPRRAHFAFSLSYANRRRTEIARALVAGPKLLVLDEPTAGMNQTETAEVLQQLLDLKRSGQTILLVEHKLDLVMAVSDRVIVLDQGVIIAQGTPDEVRRDPRVVEAYLGTSFAKGGSEYA